MRRRVASRSSSIAAAVALVALAACGSDDEPATNDTLPALGESTNVVETPLPAATAEPGVSPPPASTGSAPPASPAPLGEPAVTFADGIGGEGLVKIVEGQGGVRYLVVKSGQVLLLGESGGTTVALDLSGEVSNGSEQGLLGLAFHPDLRFAYVNYTDTSGDTQIVEYTVNGFNTFDAAAAREIMQVDQPFDNHNGGNLVFGPDKYLYIGLGDGGSADDPNRVALQLSSPLGKMLRIDPRLPDGGDGFNTPADNPYIGSEGALGEIWSIGLRNPWRYSFDSATGDLWIADVGQGNVEEIDVARSTGGFAAGKGVSFGWSAFEGDDRFNEDQPENGHTPPYYTYTHEEGRCSVTGGVVYRGAAIPELAGWYVFADYCSGEVWALDVEGDGERDLVELGTVASPVSVDQIGDELYVVSQSDGAQLVERAP